MEIINMKLEEQIQKLAESGLQLNEGIAIDDLVYSFDREAYEGKPFDLILFVYGIEVEREPWGRHVCPRAWNFDTECIAAAGDYVRIVKRLCEISGDADYLTDVSDDVDPGSGKAWLKYRVKGKQREWDVEINDDWVDLMTLSYIIDDIERDGKKFYFKDNGQAMILFYIDPASADELNKLSDDALKQVNIK
jgi:hypothetical protein